MIINLPFPGFYDSLLSSGIDTELESTAQYHHEQETEEHAEALVLSEETLTELLNDAIDYKKAELHICMQYVESLDAMIPLELGLQFAGMDSPREYNFTTDRLNATITEDKAAQLFIATNPDDFAHQCKERFTSRPGFHSFYSNDADDYIAKPLVDWDENELGTLLRAFMAQSEDEIDMAVYHEIEFGTAVDEAVDWDKFREACEEARDELREAIEPGSKLQSRPCKHTMDMFAGQQV